MYALGDKYSIPVLNDTTLVKFEELTPKLQSDLLGLVERIPSVYSSTLESDGNLRDVVLAKVRASPSDFLHEDVKVSFQKNSV